ncbi:MAG: STAS-like domain-containing protein [Clostridiales bacterium]|nr:STAS-like domain-containing protein [Clostridiales bacterium]
MKEIFIKDIIGNKALDVAQGEKIYKKIMRIFKKNEQVTLNFENVETILSAFLNIAIGTLYKDYTSEYLNKNLIIKNVSKDNLFKMKRIFSRAKEYYENREEITNLLDEALYSKDGEHNE